MIKEYFNPFVLHSLSNPDLFINRESELDEAIQFLCYDKFNVRISGDRGIGKSSFLNQLHYLIKKDFQDSLVIKLELFSVLSRDTIELSQYFLSAIINEIWIELLRKDYSALIEELKLPDEKIIKSSDEGKIVSLYKFIRSSIIKSTFERGSDFGAKVLIESKMSTKSVSAFEMEGLFPYEVNNIVLELLRILKKYDKSKIILLLDEANYLNVDSADKIIRQNFNLLLNEHINYAFVTFSPAFSISYEAEKIFHQDIMLNKFGSIDTVKALIEKYVNYGNTVLKTDVMFTNESIEMIWEYTNGFPRIIQDIGYYAWASCIKNGKKSVESKLVEIIIIMDTERRNQYNQKIKANAST